MATMANMNATAAGGPVDGTPIMQNGQLRPGPNYLDNRNQLNTYIYDYFIRNEHYRLARTMIECELKMNLNMPTKPSPNARNVNGADIMGNEPDGLPTPKIPANQTAENSFLLDWWIQFWDIFSAARGHNIKGAQYISHARVSRPNCSSVSLVLIRVEPHPTPIRSAEPAHADGRWYERCPVPEHDAGHAERRCFQRSQTSGRHQPQSVRHAYTPSHVS